MDPLDGAKWRVDCGDCLPWLAGLPAGCADFVFTDPPYGHNNQDGDLQNIIHSFPGALQRASEDDPRPISNDGPEANDLFCAALPHLYRLLQPGCCCCCCCCGGGPDPQFARWSLWLDDAFAPGDKTTGGFKQAVIWDKGPMGMGWHYRRSYEVVLVGEKPGAACRWFDETNAVENIVRPIRKIIPQAEDHPTVKPVALVEHFLRLHTREGDLVIDPFCGQGTTGEACMNLNRRFLGCDIDPHWAEVARERIVWAERGLKPPKAALPEDARQGSLFTCDDGERQKAP